MTNKLKESAGLARFNFKIADCEYACSTIVNHFRPDFAVVDCSLGPEMSYEITSHLIEDPRVPFVKVVLAANEGEFPGECEKIVFARLKRPFSINEINECIDCVVPESTE
ncbi:MAG: hypothetical protein ACYS8W_09190 [Planctomycetota bacterium]